MKAKIVQIGNSRGIRIPKPLLNQCHFHDVVNLEVEDGALLIRNIKRPRTGWKSTFQMMAENKDDQLLDSESTPLSKWDKEEWQW